VTFAATLKAKLAYCPVGVTVGEGHRDYDRDLATVFKEREPANRTREPANRRTVITKDRDDGVESKTIIHHDRD
jgi:hypothetical protein